MAEGEQGWVILGGQNMAIHYVAGDMHGCGAGHVGEIAAHDAGPSDT